MGDEPQTGKFMARPGCGAPSRLYRPQRNMSIERADGTGRFSKPMVVAGVSGRIGPGVRMDFAFRIVLKILGAVSDDLNRVERGPNGKVAGCTTWTRIDGPEL